MRTLHLCAGHGGGLLASAILGHPVVGAVEYDEFAQSVLRARQRDGLLPSFPIAGDLRQFNGTSLRGTVDLVAGGIPCQGFSGAGKQLGEHDPRNLWPDALRVLRETRAPWFFLENVDRLTSFDYWGVILQDLAAAGYDARWAVLSAGSVGAPHLRKRIWLLATDTESFRRDQRWSGADTQGQARLSECGSQLANATGSRRDVASNAQPGQDCIIDAGTGPQYDHSPRRRRGPLADTDNERSPQRSGESGDARPEQPPVVGSGGIGGAAELADAQTQRCGEAWRDRPGEPQERTSGSGASERTSNAQPDLGGMADGLADRLDRPGWWAIERGLPRVAGKQPNRAERLRGCGNGQVALCAAIAYRLLGGP